MLNLFRKHPTDIDLQRFREGHLSIQRAAQVKIHVATCPSCQSTLDAYRALHQLLLKCQNIMVPDDVTECVLNLVLSNAPKKRADALKINLFVGWVGASFAFGLAGLLMFGTVLFSPEAMVLNLSGIVKYGITLMDVVLIVTRNAHRIFSPFMGQLIVASAILAGLMAGITNRRIFSDLSR